MVGILIGFTLMIFVIIKPRLFWYLLIIVCIIGAGPRVKGYLLLDELFAVFLILGAFIRISILKHRRGFRSDNIYKTVFNIWIGYMIMESLVGIIENGDMRIIRWVIFFFSVGSIAYFAQQKKNEFPVPRKRHLCSVVLITVLIYNILYLAQGMYYESISGIGEWGRYLSQDDFWSGSAYAMFPAIIALPCAIIFLNDFASLNRIIGWTSICLIMYLAFYFDSRITWIIVFGNIFVSFFRFRPKLANLLPIYSLILVFSLIAGNRTTAIIENLYETSSALWSPNKSDVGRNLALKAGFDTLMGSNRTLLIGDGMYSHKRTAVPYIKKLFLKYMPKDDFHIPGSRDDAALGLTVWRTTAFTGLLIDTGLIGMTLLAIIFFSVLRSVIINNSRTSFNLILTIALLCMWLLISNITDIVLLYIMIMPGGLIEKLSQKDALQIISKNG